MRSFWYVCQYRGYPKMSSIDVSSGGQLMYQRDCYWYMYIQIYLNFEFFWGVFIIINLKQARSWLWSKRQSKSNHPNMSKRTITNYQLSITNYQLPIININYLDYFFWGQEKENMIFFFFLRTACSIVSLKSIGLKRKACTIISLSLNH